MVMWCVVLIFISHVCRPLYRNMAGFFYCGKFILVADLTIVTVFLCLCDFPHMNSVPSLRWTRSAVALVVVGEVVCLIVVVEVMGLVVL